MIICIGDRYGSVFRGDGGLTGDRSGVRWSVSRADGSLTGDRSVFRADGSLTAARGLSQSAGNDVSHWMSMVRKMNAAAHGATGIASPTI